MSYKFHNNGLVATDHTISAVGVVNIERSRVEFNFSAPGECEAFLMSSWQFSFTESAIGRGKGVAHLSRWRADFKIYGYEIRHSISALDFFYAYPGNDGAVGFKEVVLKNKEEVRALVSCQLVFYPDDSMNGGFRHPPAMYAAFRGSLYKRFAR